ncbi:MAG: ParA family protein [Actinomycetia bacterium]|nr:ParA family protein [Actinomycetes bacterium]
MGKIIVVANAQPRSGKTTTAASLGRILQARGIACAVLDWTPAGDLATYWGVAPLPPQPGPKDAPPLWEPPRNEAEAPDIVQVGRHEAVLVMPPGNLAMLEWQLQHTRDLAPRWHRWLRTTADRWAVTVIDTGSALGPLTAAALAVADGVIVPTMVDHAALPLLAATLMAVQARRDRRPLTILGVGILGYDPRDPVHVKQQTILTTWCAAHRVPLLPGTVYRNGRLRAAPYADDRPPFAQMRDPGGGGYARWAEHLLDWVGERPQAGKTGSSG